MNQGLLDLIMFSEKRKAFLLLLQAGPIKSEETFEKIKTLRTSLLPQIKKLKDQNLVIQEEGTYRLTPIGEIIVEKMKPLVDILEIFEQNEGFWNDRKLSPIPREFLTRISELEDYELLESDMSHSFELNPEFIEQLSNSNCINIFQSYFHPRIPSFFLELAKKGIEINFALTASVFERMAMDFRKEVEEFLEHDNTKLFVLSKNEIEVPAVIAASDKIMFIGLFDSKGRFDRHFLANYKPVARKWGKELFWHYMEFADQVESFPENDS